VQPAAPNPYQAPRADLEAPALPADTNELATRWQRLGGAIVDALLGFMAHVLIYFGVTLREVGLSGGNVFHLYLRHGTAGYVAGVAVLSLAVTQWYLIAQRGQTLGKIVAGTRIVRMNGAPARLLHGVVFRKLLFSAPSILVGIAGGAAAPTLGWVLSALGLFDVLFIFGASKRCLHDLIADTRVIQVSTIVIPPDHR
jgi:uncharacterized RDD family membrane protein YckC